MTTKTLVFYAGLLYGEYTSRKELRTAIGPDNREVYNGCYIYADREWLRGDLTPVLDEDVPKELLTLVLLLS